MTTLHVIEPTLQDETGHCCSYLSSVLNASSRASLNLVLWVGHGARSLFLGRAETHAIFYRRFRKFQVIWLYARLIRNGQAFFVPTAGALDLRIIAWLLRRFPQKAPIFLHFHQFRLTPKKRDLLEKIARLNDDIHILAPTARLLSVFQQAGFAHCQEVPCPTYDRAPTEVSEKRQINRVLFAGAARKDKGFFSAISLIDAISPGELPLEFVFQVSPNHAGRYEEGIEQAIERLEQGQRGDVTLYRETLTRQAYQGLFEHAICLQLYDVGFYGDKFSGVTLDALYAGCPIITLDGTWIADTVKRFDAGVIVENVDAKTVLDAIRTIHQEADWFVANALNAGQVLRQEHDPVNVCRVLSGVRS